jgi:hypothetical protein
MFEIDTISKAEQRSYSHGYDKERAGAKYFERMISNHRWISCYNEWPLEIVPFCDGIWSQGL